MAQSSLWRSIRGIFNRDSYARRPLTVLYTEEDMRDWWRILDVDGDGTLRKDEFFLYALCAASRKVGTGIEAIFQRCGIRIGT